PSAWMRAWPFGLQALGCFISIQRQAVLCGGWTVEMPSPAGNFFSRNYIWCELHPAKPSTVVLRRPPPWELSSDALLGRDGSMHFLWIPATLLEPPSASAAFPVRDVK